MTSKECAHMERQRSTAAIATPHTSVKDADLQIQLPELSEVSDLDKISRFKALYTRLEKNRQPLQPVLNEAPKPAHDNPKLAMEEAQATYNSMMEIRQQLNQAYQEFIHLR